MEIRRRTIAIALAVVFVANLVVMGAGALHSYEQAPPVPEAVVGPDGETVATHAGIQSGKAVFQVNGLMNHGSILGNGAYFGVDYTADALRLKTEFMREYYARERHGVGYDSLDPGTRASVDAAVRADLDRTFAGSTAADSGSPTAAGGGGPTAADGRSPTATDSDATTATYTAAEVYAHERVREVYVERYHEGDRERGVPAGMVESAADARRFADFALWTALVAHADRPGSDRSYTNEWPYAPGAGNTPSGRTMVWSAVAMVLLIAGAGVGVALYQGIDLPEPDVAAVRVTDPGDVALLPSQRAASRFVPLAAGLFLVQVLLGALLAHYYVERDAVFGLGAALGVDVLQWLPFALAKTYHLDLAILWVATLWIGAGLFLPGVLTGHEPDRQAAATNGLFAALVVVVVGGFAGIWLGANGFFDGDLWWILGNEGLEYLEVGRLWQVGLLAGFVGWTALVYRGFRPLLRREARFGLAHMILYAGGSIGLLFVAGMLYTPSTNMVMTEFWRWWVVHMWVEGAFEFFIVAVVGITLVSMGLLEKRSAEKAVALQVLFVMGTGVIGVSHHYWWIGQAEVWLPLGSVFSTLELIPLVMILFEAIGEYRALADSDASFAYSLPFAFIIASGVWNFVGAGVLGFFINLPLINYYEHGTYLTVAHAHAAMFGAFGLLALGMAVYVLRLTVSPDAWHERRLRWSFWLWNAGLAVMVLVSLLPVGFLQLETAFTEGYAAARSLAFYERPLVQALFWARFPGDTMIIAGTALFCYDVLRKRAHLRGVTDPEDAHDGRLPRRALAEEDD